ncbi:MAG TPA: amidohydrolase [Gemmatimonadales bacterium]|nr:amidohydrolase [Gemmatimonadales bacterium]
MRARHAVASLLAGLAACSPPTPVADLVVFGPVWTGDSTTPTAEAVAVAGDSILAVGDSATIAALVGEGTEVIHAPGGLVTPGLVDDHVHFSDGGAQLASVDLRDAATPAEFIARIKAFVATQPAGTWILGGVWDHERWGGTPLPERSWIDSITPDHPVFVQRLDGHMALANSKALALAGITRSTADIPGGTILRDARGEPTGLLKDEAMGPVFRVIPPPTDLQADSAVAAAMRHANRKGLTGVVAVSAPWHEIAATRRLRAAGQQTLRVAFHPMLGDWRRVADTLAAHGPGDDWIRLAGVKGFVDGSLGSTTALFFRPYLDEPGSTGLMVTPEADLRAWIGAADSAGLQVVVHAIGDRANALLLDIFDSVATAHGPRDRGFRIEHAQHLRAEEIARLAPLGVLASMQPYHAADDGRWAAKRIREPELAGTYAFRAILDAGATLLFGSDWYVAPLDPVLGIWAAVARQTIDGANPEGWHPEQRITVDEALRAYTSANAYGMFAEARRGMLKPGMLADITVLDRDLRAIPAAEIRDAEVVATVVGGAVVYRRR